MKKMKKRVKTFALAATLILCTLVNVVPAHAAGVSADQYLKKMTKAANKVKSYEATTTTVQNAITNGETANVKTVQKVISFSEPMKAKAVSTTYMKVDGESSKQKTIMYLKKNSKGKTITYVSLDGKKYYKMDMSGIEDSLKSIDTDIYSNTRIVKENVKVNKVNAVQISAEISGKDLGDAMTEIFSGLGLGDEFSFDTSALQPIKVNIWIDQKTYLPIKLSTDMTAFVNDYMELLVQSLEMEGEEDATALKMNYTKASSTVTYSKYNKAADFKIPKACK